jgi:hypothetical protein
MGKAGGLRAAGGGIGQGGSLLFSLMCSWHRGPMCSSLSRWCSWYSCDSWCIIVHYWCVHVNIDVFVILSEWMIVNLCDCEYIYDDCESVYEFVIRSREKNIKKTKKRKG